MGSSLVKMGSSLVSLGENSLVILVGTVGMELELAVGGCGNVRARTTLSEYVGV